MISFFEKSSNRFFQSDFDQCVRENKMKVFEDQKAQFESQEVFRRLNRETEVSLWQRIYDIINYHQISKSSDCFNDLEIQFCIGVFADKRS